MSGTRNQQLQALRDKSNVDEMEDLEKKKEKVVERVDACHNSIASSILGATEALTIFVTFYAFLFPKGLTLCIEWDNFIALLCLICIKVGLWLKITVQNVNRDFERLGDLEEEDGKLDEASEKIIIKIGEQVPPRVASFKAKLRTPLRSKPNKWFLYAFFLIPYIGFLVMGICNSWIGKKECKKTTQDCLSLIRMWGSLQ
ncbi:hypothetical protein IFM89_038052 [Coptis chinensis]|uniref:Transmembrane protein n=1 Tax=Coptis chinensis TaxID=261450 RepID=A0A835HE60_9MAGN|nr:hypothetical protein IFM89_038052 [Coptis chinensis]